MPKSKALLWTNQLSLEDFEVFFIHGLCVHFDIWKQIEEKNFLHFFFHFSKIHRGDPYNYDQNRKGPPYEFWKNAKKIFSQFYSRYQNVSKYSL